MSPRRIRAPASCPTSRRSRCSATSPPRCASELDHMGGLERAPPSPPTLAPAPAKPGPGSITGTRSAVGGFEIALGFEGGHAAGAGGGHGLTPDRVLHVAGGEDPRHRRLGGAGHVLDVAVRQ